VYLHALTSTQKDGPHFPARKEPRYPLNKAEWAPPVDFGQIKI